MKKIIIVVAGLIVALALACSATPTINTKAPTATTMPQVDTPTLRPAPEWALETISVNGDTVIVSVFVHSTASIEVALDGNPPTQRDDILPILSFIFEDFAPGEHPIELRAT
ncbi:MAG: hypothetical protein H8E48_00650, partial [Chloroflexi bacterium]|nr:hypothetical protein [Chloroflexota bacterium]